MPLLPVLFLPSLGLGELALIFVIVLILFGPGKLPQVAKSLGEGIRQFKKSANAAATPSSEEQDSSKPSEEPSASSGPAS